jgi:hypothetical protein
MKEIDSNQPKNFHIWIGFFLYTLIIGLIIQLIILPYIFPAWNAGDGLLKGLDTEKFHQYILNDLAQLKTNGWDTWVLKSRGNAILGVAVLFYSLLGPHPWAMLPLNSVLNATAGLSIFLMLLGFIKERRIALIATLPYLLFPTSLSWTAQFHNDNYMVAGVALFLLGWFQFSFRETWFNWKKIGLSILNIFIGSLLIWFVRNYVLNILEIFTIIVGSFLSISLITWMIRKKISWQKAVPAICVIWISFGMILFVTKLHLVNGATKIVYGTSKSDSGSLVDLPSNTIAQENVESTRVNYVWTRTSWLPVPIDKKIKDLIKTRVDAYRPSSGSNLDDEIELTNVVDVIRYLPRAFEIGFFAPFPYQWIEQGKKAPNTMMRRVAGLEMVLIYISYIGLLFAVWKWRKISGLWTFLIFCSGLIIIYAIAVINIGTLHRFRYGFLMPIVGLGVLGWFEIFKTIISKMKNNFNKRV